MATLGKLCLFTHTKSFIMFLLIAFFTFIFPFEAQQCCAWIVLRTSSMSYLTLLRLLDVCRWIFVSILFLAINTCCVKGWKVAQQIFARREDGFITSIMFISCIIYFRLHCSILFRCLFVLYLFDSHLLFGSFFFNFYKHLFAATHLYHVHFSHCWVCIVLLFVVVFLLDYFLHYCLGFQVFDYFFKITTIYLKWFDGMYHELH